uniref:protein-tyrosine-phosphatase n=1 Tax=Laticauda laticaudata TaxID=8630 RepID=A0A8C5RRN1_LATLA
MCLWHENIFLQYFLEMCAMQINQFDSSDEEPLEEEQTPFQVSCHCSQVLSSQVKSQTAKASAKPQPPLTDPAKPLNLERCSLIDIETPFIEL